MHSGLFEVTSSGGRLISDEQAASVAAERLQRLNIPYDMSSGAPVAVTDYQQISNLTTETLPEGWLYLPDSQRFKNHVLNDTDRTILGVDQEQWLTAELKASKQRKAIWQVLGQQVLMGKLGLPALTDEQLQLDKVEVKYRPILKMMQVLAKDNLPFNLDAWDGYPVCRERVFNSLVDFGVNPIVLAGDTHNGWAFNLADEQGRAVAVEIGTPSVNSPGLETYLATEPKVLAQAMQDASSELFAVETARRGWSELVLTPDSATNQWHFVSTVLDRQFSVSSAERQQCRAGDRRFL